MSASTRRGGSRRVRRIWLSMAATAVGLIALTTLAVRLRAHRDTDLGDPSVGVRASLRHHIPPDAPPLRFTDVAAQVGITMRHGPGSRSRTLPEDTGSGVAWGDYDGDGDPDLYWVNFAGPVNASPDPAGHNRLYRNDAGRFVDVTTAAGVADAAGFGMGATFADYDDDGDLDLYVTNYGPNRLYRNRGDGTFEEVGAAAGVDDPLWSTGATWGDYDRDGDLDLYVCNYLRYDAAMLRGVEIDDPTWEGVPFTLNPNAFDAEPNRLYRNRGNGTFEDVAIPAGVANAGGRSLAAVFCDLDGDGWLDLYVNNDVSPNALFRNLGATFTDATGPRFVDVSTLTGTADPRGSMGLSVGDLGGGTDGAPDGLPDLFLTHWVAQENALYQAVDVGGGMIEYRDKTRERRLGEVSLDAVGWGCALVDMDLDGRMDLAVANGNTLEQPDDPGSLIAQPMFLFWNDGTRFHNLAPAAGEALARPHGARGMAAADYDGDGDMDLAVAVNRGQPLLLRNDTTDVGHALAVRLSGPASACFGAKVEVRSACGRQIQWWGADVSFLSMHASELIFGLGACPQAEMVLVTWSDGEQSRLVPVPAGRAIVPHPSLSPARQGGSRAAGEAIGWGRPVDEDERQLSRDVEAGPPPPQ